VKTTEIRSITGLRAFAALGVYLNHFGNPSWFPNYLSNLHSNGGLGVPFFFVLSGFVLTLSYEQKSVGTGTFYLNRFARIAPTYFIGLFVASLYISLTDFSFSYLFVMHIFGLQAWFPSSDSGFAFNGPGWTISVEIFFYALFPYLIKLFRSGPLFLRRWTSVIFVGMATSLIPFFVHIRSLGVMRGLENDHIWPTFLPVHYLGLFIIGIGGCMARTSIQGLLANDRVRAAVCDSVVLLCISLFTLINFKDPEHPLVASAAQFWLLGIPTLCMILLLSVTPTSFLSRFLASWPCWFAGRISLVFYLLHVPVVWWSRRIFPSHSYEMHFLAVVIVSISIHLLVELPCSKQIRRFARQ